MSKQDKKPKRKSLTKTRAVFWVVLAAVILSVIYLATPPPINTRNQCENLSGSLPITEMGKTVNVPIDTANIEVSANGLILHPYTTDAYAHVTWLKTQGVTGRTFLNQLDDLTSFKSTYGYSATQYQTTQFYRGSIITETGTVTDALFFVEHSSIETVHWMNCVVKT